MTYNNKKTIEKFFELCDWLIQTYEFRKYLFDDNPDLDALKDPRYEHFFYRIHEVFQESWMHQLAKLHDPAMQGKNINLSLEYIIEYVDWEPSFREELIFIKKDMDTLHLSIKAARNKLLSHNDYKTIIGSNEFFGKFEEGEDVKYFKALKNFCERVSKKALNNPFVYDDLVNNDIDIFMSQFLKEKI